ncbi:hypothetical protein [Aliamphritea ceti]|uniref:hypothetical protein n=1 Tax=Aliamphritea ceti TaxID=1524258 RepID=UPI0021C2B2F8|nr:hypothetical protein [Aliamphritea ceti]
MAGKATKQEEPKNELISVEFIKPWSRYSKGDIAGFEADKVQKLIDAKLVVEPGTAEEAEQKKEDPAA